MPKAFMESIKSGQFKIALFIIIAAVGAALILYFAGVFNKPAQNENTSQNSGQPSTSTSPNGQTPEINTPSVFVPPIDNWEARVTKKPFGIYITPQTSPVQPERFSGYHTGVDFEIFAEEQNKDVPIYAICDGKLLQKRTATGYGGITILACPHTNFGEGENKLNGEDITVVYGHLRLTSVSANAGDQIKAGDKLGVLGAGFSNETDGERKHLHLGIHKGTAINILGYVQNLSDLDSWADATTYLK